MRYNNAVISGSFVLQCILGETWNSDINVYIPVNKWVNCKKDDNYLLNNFYQAHQHYKDLPARSKTDMDDYLHDWYSYEYINEELPFYDEFDMGIINIFNFNVNTIVQTNWVDTSTKSIKFLKSFVNQKFDIDVCKSVYYIDNNNKEHVEIAYINDITTRITNFDNSNSYLYRCIEYDDKGFKFRNIMNLTYYDEIFTKEHFHSIFPKFITIKKLKQINENCTSYKILNNFTIKKNFTNNTYIGKDGNLIIDIQDCTNCEDCHFKLLNKKYEHYHINNYIKNYLFIVID